MPLSGNQTTGSSPGELYTYDPSSNQIFHLFTNGRVCIGNAQYPIFTKPYVGYVNGNINTFGALSSYRTSAFQVPQDSSSSLPFSGSTYQGLIRYNLQRNCPEYYDGTNWNPFGNQPTLTSISPTSISATTGGYSSIILNGTNFDVGGNVFFIDKNNNTYNSTLVYYTNLNQVIAKTPTNASGGLPASGSPYSVKIVNPIGLSATLSAALTTI